jgi:hypothetical protein
VLYKNRADPSQGFRLSRCLNPPDEWYARKNDSTYLGDIDMRVQSAGLAQNRFFHPFSQYGCQGPTSKCTVAECSLIPISCCTTELQLEYRSSIYSSEQYDSLTFDSEPVCDSSVRKLPLHEPFKQFAHHSTLFVFGGVCGRRPYVQHLQRWSHGYVTYYRVFKFSHHK